MSNVLITTLGKANPINGNENAHGRYRTLKYDFGNYISVPTAFFGKALFDYLCKCGQGIDKIIIVGTAGSMWDAWLEVDENGTAFFENEEFAGELQKFIDENAVTASSLARLSEILSGSMKIPVLCKLIPYGRNASEQLEILSTIAESGVLGDSVFIDVTHGLRHLPMFEMLSSFLMQSRFVTQGFYYGAAELRQNGVAPTIRLDGATHIIDWMCAISVLKRTGNVSPLADMLGMESLREQLLKCQFYEQMNNVTQARKFARQILDGLDQLPTIGRLFRSDIEEVFLWAKENRFAERQFLQAEKAYRNGDYLRSVILFMETVITSEMQGDASNGEIRRQVQERLNREEGNEWHILKGLRNSLAHGGVPEGNYAREVMAMRQDESTFESNMESIIQWVRGRLPQDRKAM